MEVEEYRRAAVKVGLPLQFVIKEFAMFELLSKLISSLEWPLVGGTAINRIYLGELGRFSEDLDFEVYGKKKISLPQVDGFERSGPFVYRRNVRFEYSFRSPLGKDKIRMDFNLKPAAEIETEMKVIRFVSGGVIAGVKTFSIEALIARKIFALAFRNEGKDIYDLWMCRSLVEKKKLKKELEAILRIERQKESAAEFLEIVFAKAKSAHASELAKINPYIPVDKRVDWKIAAADVAEFLEGL